MFMHMCNNMYPMIILNKSKLQPDSYLKNEMKKCDVLVVVLFQLSLSFAGRY